MVRRPHRRPLHRRHVSERNDHRNHGRRGGRGAAAAACWHPFAVDGGVDYGNEPTTLVEFTLSETADGVLLRIVESGFDAIPQSRRADAFEANSGGWAKQTELVRKYLSLGQRV
jgi:hypothetical protein